MVSIQLLEKILEISDSVDNSTSNRNPNEFALTIDKVSNSINLPETNQNKISGLNKPKRVNIFPSNNGYSVDTQTRALAIKSKQRQRPPRL
jgi:hypothetical protein